MDLTTPALLFPAISLLLLAYTGRFLAVASVTRSLHSDWREAKELTAEQQLESLRRRLQLIQAMQLNSLPTKLDAAATGHALCWVGQSF